MRKGHFYPNKYHFFMILILVFHFIVSCADKLPDQDAHVRTVSEVTRTADRALDKYTDKDMKGIGFINVTASPYHADKTGKIDATAAIQQALKDARDARMIAFLPAGRYLVSTTITGIQGTVEWDDWPYEGFVDPWLSTSSFEYPNVITGPSTGERAVIVLADNSPGFDDPGNPKPLLHFWSRMEYGDIEKTKPQSNINFNQKIIDIDFELGKNNPGAIAINHQGAEGSVIEDVNISASGAFAGIQNAPGSGGAISGVSVDGGKYGFYFRNNTGSRGSQPSPVVSGIRLTGQTEHAILFDGRGPLTIVGALIEGSGIHSDCPPSANWNGALNIIDVVLRLKNKKVAIRSNHSVVMDNVFIENADTAVHISGQWTLSGNSDGWLEIKRCAASAKSKSGRSAGDSLRRDDLWVDGEKTLEPLLEIGYSAPLNPEEIISNHTWQHPFPSWQTKGAVNVKNPPYLARGDGVFDDAEAIQRAIDENEVVFLPKGIFAISKPLLLKSKTKLIGLGNVQTIITAFDGAEAYKDPDNPLPLIETVDDPDAETILAFLKLLVPVRNPCVYAICWRAGRNSVVRNVYPIREPSHPHGTAMGYPMVRIEKSGGGKWYTNVLLHWWDQGPTYRHLLIDGTIEPLQFYMLEPQHGRGEYMVEIRNSKNIDVFAIKSECDFGVLSLQQCSNIRIFGYAGNGMPHHGWPLFNIQDSDNYLLANVNPQHKNPGHWGALGISHDPSRWYMVRCKAEDQKEEILIKGTEQFSLFLEGNPKVSLE